MLLLVQQQACVAAAAAAHMPPEHGTDPARGGGGVDVLVLGATPAGIAAAISAARAGQRVTLLETHNHVGGMMSGGLGWDDVDCSYCPKINNASAATHSSTQLWPCLYWRSGATTP